METGSHTETDERELYKLCDDYFSVKIARDSAIEEYNEASAAFRERLRVP